MCYASKFQTLCDFTREFNQDWYFLNSAFNKESHENLLVLHDLLLMKIRCLLLTGPIDKISLWWTIMHTTVLGVCVRDPPRFFDQVGHQTTSASTLNYLINEQDGISEQGGIFLNFER
jgi:hypothetical protein